MADDPFRFVQDAPLFVVPRTLERLRALRAETGWPPAGWPPALERLVDDLLDGIEAHPTRFWAMTRFRRALDEMRDEDAAARRRFGEGLERIMGILGIEDTEGIVAYYRSA